MQTFEVTPEIALAIETGVAAATKGMFDGKARAQVTPDQTLKGLVLNLTLEVGALTIGHDTDRAPTASIPTLTALALMVQRMGATREAALEMLREVMEQAIALNESATKKLLQETGVAEAQKKIQEQVISKLPRTPVSKTVKASDVKLTVTGFATCPVE